MPDPQILYIVMAAVTVSLAVWVIVVLSRPDGNKEDAAVRAPATEPGTRAPAPAPESSPDPASASEPTRDAASALAAAPLLAPAGAREAAAAPKPADKVHLPARPKPWLHSHAEITDELLPGVAASLEIDEEDEPTGPHALILVTAVGRTDPGLKRKHNEDAYAILEDHHLFVIADGMGRHAAGEVASRLCVEAITEAFRTSTFGPPRDPPLPRRAARLRGATLLANERILAAAADHEEYTGMGTTVVSAYFSANNQRVYIAHVGDSRCYRLRAGTLTQLTTDHTLGTAGIEGKTAAVLSRAVGVEPNVEVDVGIEAPVPGDVYLLCSDGLSRMVPSTEIESTLVATPDLDEATKTLTDLANRGGGRDNITVILVRVDKAKPPAA